VKTSFNILAWMLEVAISLRVMRPTSYDTRLMEGVDDVMQAAVFCLFKSPLKNVKTLRGEHAFASSVYVVDASYCGSVHFWEYRIV